MDVFFKIGYCSSIAACFFFAPSCNTKYMIMQKKYPYKLHARYKDAKRVQCSNRIMLFLCRYLTSYKHFVHVT